MKGGTGNRRHRHYIQTINVDEGREIPTTETGSGKVAQVSLICLFIPVAFEAQNVNQVK